MSLGQSDPWVHCVMGLTHFVSKEPDEAIAQFKKALDLNPSFALAHAYLGAQLAHAGEPEEAIEAATQAIRLSPRDPELFHFYVASGTASFVARRYHDAVDWAKKALREKPDVPSAHRLLASVDT